MNIDSIALADDAVIVCEHKTPLPKKKEPQLQGGKLKRLKSLRSELHCRLRCAGSHAERELIKRQLSHVNTKLQRLKGEPVVTEHAILRYLERVHGVNIRAIEKEILNNETFKMVDDFGYGTAKIPHSSKKCRLIVNDKVVITIEV